jgi:hypothetical protein
MSPPDTKTEGELLEEEMENDVNVPWLYRWSKISNYYGVTVRELLIAAAILMLVTAPFYTDNIASELPFIILGAIILITTAALTSPMKRNVISADAVVSGVGLVIFEIWALSGYQTDPVYQFVLRQALAILFLLALYFSTKTLRSMFLGQVHVYQEPVTKMHDFHEDVPKPMSEATPVQDDIPKWREQAKESLEELNEREKFDFQD